jgi:hypothetical protein
MKSFLPPKRSFYGYPMASLDENVAMTLGPEFGRSDAFPVMAVEKMEWDCREVLNVNKVRPWWRPGGICSVLD